MLHARRVRLRHQERRLVAGPTVALQPDVRRTGVTQLDHFPDRRRAVTLTEAVPSLFGRWHDGAP